MSVREASYVRPEDVHAPKRHWKLFHVLFDGGEERADRPGLNHSLAIGRWDNKPVLAMRWNGGEGNPIGNPQSRGLPTWFVVPDQHARQILESDDFNLSDNKVKFARDFIEGRRAYFLTHCPTPWCANFKNLVLASYPTSELQARLKDLDDGRPMFYCIHCDQQWVPGTDEAIRLKAELQKAWEHHVVTATL